MTNDRQSGKLKIAVLFGGPSPEHDVSLLSASNVLAALSPERYSALPIYIDRQGIWRRAAYSEGRLAMPQAGPGIAVFPGGKGQMVELAENGMAIELPRPDLIFPVLHGMPGEDGSVQGLIAALGVPLVGCAVAGSAISIDKDIAKRLLREAGIPVARDVIIHRQSALPDFEALESALGLPLFIKPATQGSSVGVSKVKSAQDLNSAFAEGFKFDRKLIAEEFIKGREIEFAVLENPDGTLFVSRPGEISPAESHGFYSYDAKYVDQHGAALQVPANLSEALEKKMRDTAARAFRACGCDAMARVDFFLREDESFVVNELNTIPGFTDISMYSKAMNASGVSYAELLDRLVEHAVARGAA